MDAWPAAPVPTLPRSDDPRLEGRVRVFDTVTRAQRIVGPDHGTAGLYVCGITPYDATHLGHANTYVSFDLVNRVWRDLGPVGALSAERDRCR